MITISLCMIVKNEERILARCLDSVADLVEEIIIVDTGSTDRTKEIAAKYTDKIFDFEWIRDFAAARNFAFSKCTMDYIYAADADEVLDDENRERFRVLKEAMLPEVELVQMKYGNQLQYSTIYNYDEEYRPKMYKRLREFIWQYPVHEAVRLEPIIFDSDVVITHLPEGSHTSRDLSVFDRMIRSGQKLDARMHNLYAKELFVSGEDSDFLNALDFFKASTEDETRPEDSLLEAYCVAARASRLAGDIPGFFKYAMKAVTGDGCSEICYELGCYYKEKGDLKEASIWFYHAAYETESILNVHCGDDWPKAELNKTQ